MTQRRFRYFVIRGSRKIYHVQVWDGEGALALERAARARLRTDVTLGDLVISDATIEIPNLELLG